PSVTNCPSTMATEGKRCLKLRLRESPVAEPANRTLRRTPPPSVRRRRGRRWSDPQVPPPRGLFPALSFSLSAGRSTRAAQHAGDRRAHRVLALARVALCAVAGDG